MRGTNFEGETDSVLYSTIVDPIIVLDPDDLSVPATLDLNAAASLTLYFTLHTTTYFYLQIEITFEVTTTSVCSVDQIWLTDSPTTDLFFENTPGGTHVITESTLLSYFSHTYN